ncbi:MAG: glycosyltransferase family 1 protein [Bacteroidetes bacterium]|nr:glycosyltransferase family 1 protein [Bacteroidota bacterium]
MKIAIEAQRIFRRKKHGMDFVALELIKMLQKIDTQNEYYILVASGNDKCLTSSGNFQVVEVGSTTNYFLWEQWSLPRALKRINPDVVHCTSNTAPLYCPYPLVLTLHDIIFLEKKIGKNVSPYQNLGRIYRRFVVPRVVQNAKQVITVSDYERKRILGGLDRANGKTVTVYNGVGREFRVVHDFEATVHKYITDRGYWFLLGNTDPKKNLCRTLQAYASYAALASAPRPLLIADLDTDYLDRLLREYGIFSVRNLIHTPGYIPHDDLPYVYNGAFAFLFPSLRESFGLPVLEAMACGTPVVTSNTSALPEVAGIHALMVSPESVEEIMDKMLRLEKSSDLHKAQAEYGIGRAKEFSWGNTAKRMLEIYNSVSQHG